jgi:hypothetical protein
VQVVAKRTTHGTYSYWIARSLFVRAVAGVALVALLSAYFQYVPLVGEHGVLPARLFLARVRSNEQICAESSHFGSLSNVHLDHALAYNATTSDVEWQHLDASWNMSIEQNCTLTDYVRAFAVLPTLMWLDCSDLVMQSMIVIAMLLSASMVLGFLHCSIALAMVWLIYLSLLNVGQVFYGFGWESQVRSMERFVHADELDSTRACSVC